MSPPSEDLPAVPPGYCRLIAVTRGGQTTYIREDEAPISDDLSAAGTTSQAEDVLATETQAHDSLSSAINAALRGNSPAVTQPLANDRAGTGGNATLPNFPNKLETVTVTQLPAPNQDVPGIRQGPAPVTHAPAQQVRTDYGDQRRKSFRLSGRAGPATELLVSEAAEVFLLQAINSGLIVPQFRNTPIEHTIQRAVAFYQQRGFFPLARDLQAMFSGLQASGLSLEELDESIREEGEPPFDFTTFDIDELLCQLKFISANFNQRLIYGIGVVTDGAACEPEAQVFSSQPKAPMNLVIWFRRHFEVSLDGRMAEKWTPFIHQADEQALLTKANRPSVSTQAPQPRPQQQEFGDFTSTHPLSRAGLLHSKRPSNPPSSQQQQGTERTGAAQTGKTDSIDPLRTTSGCSGNHHESATGCSGMTGYEILDVNSGISSEKLFGGKALWIALDVPYCKVLALLNKKRESEGLTKLKDSKTWNHRVGHAKRHKFGEAAYAKASTELNQAMRDPVKKAAYKKMLLEARTDTLHTQNRCPIKEWKAKSVSSTAPAGEQPTAQLPGNTQGRSGGEAPQPRDRMAPPASRKRPLNTTEPDGGDDETASLQRSQRTRLANGDDLARGDSRHDSPRQEMPVTDPVNPTLAPEEGIWVGSDYIYVGDIDLDALTSIDPETLFQTFPELFTEGNGDGLPPRENGNEN